MGDFKFPECHSWPPFWTLQTNPTQLTRQIELWSNLIRAYMKQTGQDAFDISAIDEMPLFNNTTIKRSLSKQAVITILDKMAENGNAKWLNPTKTRVRILWRSLKKWANVLKKWSDDNGQGGTVFTLWELRTGDITNGEDFHNMDPELLVEVCELMHSEGTAQFLKGPSPDESGVKFNK